MSGCIECPSSDHCNTCGKHDPADSEMTRVKEFWTIIAMEQGFDYFSILTKETFWRPIGELFDGRFEFITMEELCSTN